MAKFSHRMPVFVVILLLITAGCNSGQLTTGFDYEGELNRTEAGFIADGIVYVYEFNPEAITLRNTSLALYTAEGDLICEEPLPPAPENSKVNVSLQTTIIPKYVIVEAPIVLRDSQYPIVYDVYIGTRWAERRVRTADELPVDPYQQGPECPPLNQSAEASSTG